MSTDIWITYSGYILLVIGGIFSLYKIRYEITKRKEFEDIASIREKRFNVYKDFLSKLDLMNSELYSQQFSEESKLKANAVIEQVKNNPLNLDGYYEFIKYQTEIIMNFMENYNKYLDELNQLRLVSSKELLELLDKYQEKSKQYLEANGQSMIMHQINLPGQFDFDIISNYGKQLEELILIRKKMEQQMRIDIGND